jgi:PEP-CTERM motif
VKAFRRHGSGMATAAIALLLSSATAQTARADLMITNGGFEDGFAGWTRLDQVGSDGTFVLQTGTSSPVNGDPVPAPPEGSTAAMTDARGPGAHVLYQDFVVPSLPIALTQLRFDLFIGNRAETFFTPSPASLDFSTPTLNQQGRVDLLRAGTDPFSVAPSDVLLNIYQTRPGDPALSGYTPIITDVTSLLAANAGNTLRLRFAEVDNVLAFQLGVDNVSLTAVPEPSSLVLGGIGALLGLAGYAHRSLRLGA